VQSVAPKAAHTEVSAPHNLEPGHDVDKRRSSFWSFVAGLVLYPISLYNTFGAIGRAGASHSAAGGIAHVEQMWWTGRVLASLAALLLLVSIILGFIAPPERGRRLWWVLPSTIFLIVIVYFDFFQIGFS
jgi:uncharacterized BrkB/YihY/UPF0761 family membrane protein